MPLTLNAVIDSYAARLPKAVLVLLTLDHPTFTFPLRLVRNNENIDSRGDTYLAFPFDVELPESSDSIREARLITSPVAIPGAATADSEVIVEGVGELSRNNIKPNSIEIFDSGVTNPSEATIVDDGNGGWQTLLYPAVSGFVNYETGEFELNITLGPAGTLTANYMWYPAQEYDSLVARLRSIPAEDGPVVATIELVLSDDLDTVQVEFPSMEWRGMTISMNTIDGALKPVTTINDSLQSRARRFTPKNFPGLF